MEKVTRIFMGVCFAIVIINYWLLDWFTQKSVPKFASNEKHFNATLANLLKPRWPGSPGHAEVADFLWRELIRLGFETFRDELVENIRYTNIVGVMNVDAEKFLLLCCHYDSKLIKGAEEYVGAIDGAVSCAIILNIVKTLKPYLHKEFNTRRDIGLALVFFDGHESFEDVTQDTNLLIGSGRFAETETIPMDSIELVLAFNLIGAPNHIYMSHFENTNVLHRQLVKIEEELRESGQLRECPKLFHKVLDLNADIEDDHYSFLQEGVPAMHIAPHSYPEVWHTVADNLTNLHWPTIRNMISITTRFVYDYISNYGVISYIN